MIALRLEEPLSIIIPPVDGHRPPPSVIAAEHCHRSSSMLTTFDHNSRSLPPTTVGPRRRPLPTTAFAHHRQSLLSTTVVSHRRQPTPSTTVADHHRQASLATTVTHQRYQSLSLITVVGRRRHPPPSASIISHRRPPSPVTTTSCHHQSVIRLSPTAVKHYRWLSLMTVTAKLSLHSCCYLILEVSLSDFLIYNFVILLSGKF